MRGVGRGSGAYIDSRGNPRSRWYYSRCRGFAGCGCGCDYNYLRAVVGVGEQAN